jgi:hypothetical protein
MEDKSLSSIFKHYSSSKKGIAFIKMTFSGWLVNANKGISKQGKNNIRAEDKLNMQKDLQKLITLLNNSKDVDRKTRRDLIQKSTRLLKKVQ